MKIIEQLRSAISHIDSWLAYNVDCRDRNISEFRDTHVSLANLRTISASFPALLDVAQAAEDAYSNLKMVEIHCPCGARPETLDTHPHVGGCEVEKALRKLAPALAALERTK